mgnify:CR=1 FL=1
MMKPFTVPEENLICIYLEDSRESLIDNIIGGLPYMDKDMKTLAEATIRKLQAMTDSEFAEQEFVFTDE